MTATTDTAGHPEMDEISDLTEGILTSTRAEEVEQHLDDCAECAEVHASLLAIQGLLGSLPDPGPMPEDVAARIDAALADETSREAGDVSRETARVSRETQSPSITTAGSGGVGSSSAPDRPAGHPRAATGPGRSRRYRRRRTIALSAVFTAAAIGLGGLLLQSLDGDSPGPADASARHSASTAGSFSKDGLEGRVSTLLSENAPRTESGSAAPKPSLMQSGKDTPSGNHQLRETDGADTAVRIPACIARGIGRSESPLAAEQGVYEGSDAYLVVLPHATDNTQVSAYVVDAACVHERPAPPGTVLLARSYPRH
ncbi:anti-sigma factor family protein [Streptomyces sp. NPDC058045]|uniref:anti-sigma factor family protein n=1 Tax=Streptomyces sp. NPDC058045 TaxID=3346311 RepID=UPI0036E870F6